ncbi:MAG: nucleotidyltransferase domain-containing protein [Candidatus Brocadiae bacterium]|nr:nucleotidyltransferase domain-containing protein [Candidatus Brocadiia bacterium]
MLFYFRKTIQSQKIGLFGSFSRNEATEESDVDFVVEFSEPLGWEFFDLQAFLQEKLGRKVDLVPLQGLKPRWKKIIAKDIVYL